jgi:hypothetical protein
MTSTGQNDPVSDGVIAAWYAEIDRRLNEVRPDRYHETDTAWREPIVRWAEEHMPAQLRAHAAWGMGGDEVKP